MEGDDTLDDLIDYYRGDDSLMALSYEMKDEEPMHSYLFTSSYFRLYCVFRFVQRCIPTIKWQAIMTEQSAISISMLSTSVSPSLWQDAVDKFYVNQYHFNDLLNHGYITGDVYQFISQLYVVRTSKGMFDVD